jgi:uncharacterized surface protein with fasciclin (FAS1) repeats
LSTLARLVDDAGLAETLRGSGPFTLFAPTDDAFRAVPAATLASLAADQERLKAVLMFHVVAHRPMAADVRNAPSSRRRARTWRWRNQGAASPPRRPS